VKRENALRRDKALVRYNDLKRKSAFRRAEALVRYDDLKRECSLRRDKALKRYDDLIRDNALRRDNALSHDDELRGDDVLGRIDTHGCDEQPTEAATTELRVEASYSIVKSRKRGSSTANEQPPAKRHRPSNKEETKSV